MTNGFDTRHSTFDTPMTYNEAENFLEGLPRFAVSGSTAYAPGLERITAVLAAMGDPQLRYPVVHIAGTNGKGSTASLLSSISTSAGKRTGLHTSPHLRHVGERMRIDGTPAPEGWIADAVSRYREVFSRERVSFFEATVALSLLYFAERKVDLAVVEVGLGGRLDATNVVSPALTIITSISLDHTDILGNSIRDIAREKAGIIKKGVPVICGVEQKEAIEEIKVAASMYGGPMDMLDDSVRWTVEEESLAGLRLKVATRKRAYPGLEVGLCGRHQARNALLALLAAEMLFSDLEDNEKSIREGLRRVAALSGLRGRMEIVRKEPLVILDVGHNYEGFQAVLKSISGILLERQGQLFVMFGTMRDKDIVEMARLLLHAGAIVYTPPVYGTGTVSERAMPAEEMAHMLRSHGIRVEPVSSLEIGMLRFYEEATLRDVLLITGSHYLVAQYAAPAEK